ncbi:7-cyano-7-deazaguanine synthase [Aeromonas dhakensis]|uniref:7-cyano-7-deazaguanine synthase n=1 Tax=Aeromonas dhakensis TaxID=196024 RepID=UPI0009E6076D|nr:7-cyano-7-deazaguanine synthase [Aeromonas dhakensis]
MAKSRGDRGVRYDALALVSGGPDSTTLLYHMVKKEGLKPLALHFSTGLAPNQKELSQAKALLKEIEVPMQIFDISHFIASAGGAMPTIHSEAHVLRFGTGVILTMACAYAIQHEIPSVWLALHKEDADEATEYSPKFIDYINSGVNLIGESCEVKAPFHDWSKIDVLKHGMELNVPLQKTWSCVSPIKGVQCGACGACRARREAFEAGAIKDMTRYSFK